MDLTKREIGRSVLQGLFHHQKRISIADAVEAGKKAGVSRRTLTRACRELGVKEIHNGPYGAFWEKQ